MNAFRILLLGDSLTSGFNLTSTDHPYAIALVRSFESHPFVQLAHSPVHVVVEGEPGDTVVHTGGDTGFERRLRAALEKARREGALFDWVVVMGDHDRMNAFVPDALDNNRTTHHVPPKGTNDLFHDIPSSTITTTLQSLYDLCLSHSDHTRVLCCEVLEVDFPAPEERERARVELNAWLRLRDELPMGSLAYHLHAFRATYWDEDWVHLTHAGYDRLGEAVAREILALQGGVVRE
ncbi:hypothetical protein HDU93_007247 [Gonapodya sp. JEL0774]|nr:hypothetical protein HDU93_007247 [Gonapodya sp. JEL0774]